jgi:methyltransferase (TIGR00027 family)
LFRDPLARILVGERGKQFSDSMGRVSRFTEWSVVSRTVIIDRFVESLIKSGVDAVINLGAGLDTRPYRMNLPKDLVWIEADYSSIISHKSAVLKDERSVCQLSRVAVDLADEEKRRAFLKQAAPDAKNVLVLTEGVVPYLSQEQVRELSADLISQKRFQYWITEYFHPRVYRYLRKTARAKAMRNAPFKFYPDDWYLFFERAGWTALETRFSGEIAAEFGRKQPVPRWAEIMQKIFPKKVKEETLRVAGYVVFVRAQ